MPSRIAWPALALVLLAILAAPSFATGEQVPVGPRALGMGGAYSSIADDAAAMFWNPAGLSWVGHQELTASYANLFQSDLKDNYIAFVLPLAPRQAAGFDWYHSGFDDAELGFAENRFDLSYGARWRSLLSIGATAKYLTRSISLDGSTVKNGSGLGMDLGALASPVRGLRLALVAQDLFNTDLHYSDGSGDATVYPRSVRAGASYAPSRYGTVAVDVDDWLHVGIEGHPHPLLALRAGMARDRKNSEAPTWSAGLGLKWGILRADYAYVAPPELAATSYIGLSLAFNFNPSLVKIEDVKTDDVFASLYKRYEDHPLVTMDLKNLSDQDIDATVSLFVPEIMSRPTSQQVSLRPGVLNPRRFTAVLSDRAMRLTEDRSLPLEIQVRYQSLRLDRVEKVTRKIRVYAPGAIRWDDRVAPAVAFITTRDPAIEALARRVASETRPAATGLLRNENIALAAALSAAVSVLGVRYVPDPTTPYASTAGKLTNVDTIFYPRQTLEKRAGDCDDLTVLMAALLGNVGIATQLVDVPGHIFLLFDSGVNPSRRAGLGIPERLTVVDGDRLWIPLEATALDSGFAFAWQSGADEITASQASDPTRNLYVDVARAQAEYEPAGPAGGELTLPVDPARLNARLGSDRVALDELQGEFVRSLRVSLGENPQGRAQEINAAAQAAFLAGQFEDVLTLLDGAGEARIAPAAAGNNRANALFAMGDLDSARIGYEAARAADPGDAGILLNLGMLGVVSGDSVASAEWLARGVAGAGGEDQAAALLGLPPGGSADDELARENPKRLTPAMIRALLSRAARRVSPSPAAGTPPGGMSPTPKGPKVVPTRIGASRAGEVESLSRYLYWKP